MWKIHTGYNAFALHILSDFAKMTYARKLIFCNFIHYLKTLPLHLSENSRKTTKNLSPDNCSTANLQIIEWCMIVQFHRLILVSTSPLLVYKIHCMCVIVNQNHPPLEKSLKLADQNIPHSHQPKAALHSQQPPHNCMWKPTTSTSQ